MVFLFKNQLSYQGTAKEHIDTKARHTAPSKNSCLRARRVTSQSGRQKERMGQRKKSQLQHRLALLFLQGYTTVLQTVHNQEKK